MSTSRNVFIKMPEVHWLARLGQGFKLRRRGPWRKPSLWERIVLQVSLTLAFGLMWAAVVLAMRALAAR